MVVDGLGGEADPDDKADRFREVGEGELALNLLVQPSVQPGSSPTLFLASSELRSPMETSISAEWASSLADFFGPFETRTAFSRLTVLLC